MKRQYKIEREQSGLRYNIWTKTGRKMWTWSGGTYSLDLANQLVARIKKEDEENRAYLNGEVR